MALTKEQKAKRKAERARRAAAIERATVDGVRTGMGDEVAILCQDCKAEMLVLRPAHMTGRVRCMECGIAHWRRGAQL